MATQRVGRLTLLNNLQPLYAKPFNLSCYEILPPNSQLFNTVKQSYVMKSILIFSAMFLLACSNKAPHQSSSTCRLLYLYQCCFWHRSNLPRSTLHLSKDLLMLKLDHKFSGIEKVYVDRCFCKSWSAIFKINEQPCRASLNNALAAQHSAEAILINAQLEVERLAYVNSKTK